MTYRKAPGIAICALLLGAGYLLGSNAGGLERDAFAGAYWNADANAYVTSDGPTLYF